MRWVPIALIAILLVAPVVSAQRPTFIYEIENVLPVHKQGFDIAINFSIAATSPDPDYESPFSLHDYPEDLFANVEPGQSTYRVTQGNWTRVWWNVTPTREGVFTARIGYGPDRCTENPCPFPTLFGWLSDRHGRIYDILPDAATDFPAEIDAWWEYVDERGGSLRASYAVDPRLPMPQDHILSVKKEFYAPNQSEPAWVVEQHHGSYAEWFGQAPHGNTNYTVDVSYRVQYDWLESACQKLRIFVEAGKPVQAGNLHACTDPAFPGELRPAVQRAPSASDAPSSTGRNPAPDRIPSASFLAAAMVGVATCLATYIRGRLG